MVRRAGYLLLDTIPSVFLTMSLLADFPLLESVDCGQARMFHRNRMSQMLKSMYNDSMRVKS